MRIGILTVPFNNNYGGFLQAFALKRILEDWGHEVLFINRRRNKKLVNRYKSLFLFPYYFFKEQYGKCRQSYLSKYTNEFIEKFLSPITDSYYTTEHLKTCLSYNFDIILVGSDQVWRYQYAKESIDDFFCNFTEDTNIKCLSYAASFGTSKQEYPIDKLKTCSNLLKKFSLISVRERDGRDILINHFGIDSNRIKVVLDPTLLLKVEDYERLIKDINAQRRYVFTYILDKNDDNQRLINWYCQKKELMEISMSAQTGEERINNPIEPIELWLARIYHSDFVITDSFHGTVFSILFNKPFIVYGNKERGTSRINCLLESFDLKNRYIESSKDVFFDNKIDWRKVNSIIAQEREKSRNILFKALYESSNCM